MGELLCGVAVLLLIAGIAAYCNPVAERYRARKKVERYQRLIATGWCHHKARAIVYGDPLPLTRYDCCNAMAVGEESASPVQPDGCVYLDASGPGEPKVIHGEDRIREAMTRAWEGRGQVYAIDLRAMAASLHRDGHLHDADHCDLCHHEPARDGGESHG